MKYKPSLEEFRNLPDKELAKHIRLFKKANYDVRYYKKVFVEFKEKHETLLYNKENKPDEFKKEQHKAAYYKIQRWRDRIKFVIQCEDRFLTSNEIINIIYQYDPLFFKLSLFPYNTISENIRTAIRYVQLRKEIIRGERGHFYGLPNFYDENGKIKSEYKNGLPY